jgi:valyl-tRNA synthetase
MTFIDENNKKKSIDKKNNEKYCYTLIQEYIKKNWDAEKIYNFSSSEKGPFFSIDTPPPTISGNLHIGHIFSYTQADIIARYERIKGKNVFYPFGFDDNGLPTERYVEKKNTIVSLQKDRKEFIALCLKETNEMAQKFKDLWCDIGLSVDWDYCYSTISRETQKISQASFIALYKKGYIYRKYEPALFCTAFQTSVAQAELETVEKESIFFDIIFIVKETNEKIIIATTRPEMLYSCVAIMVHPDDIRYKALHKKNIIVPLTQAIVSVIPDENVIPEKGSGIVMCCTFGDALDVAWYKKYSLPYKQSLLKNGKMSSLTGPLEGLNVPAAREKIIFLLKEQGCIVNEKKIMHMVCLYERSKKEIEYLLLPQWFVAILKYKDTFLELADKIQWSPEHMKQRYIDWVKNLEWDWCISRQRFYGIPFPVWYDENEAIVFPDEKDLPVDPLYDRPSSYTGDKLKLKPESDVMDTWNTSALTPLICYELYNKKNNKSAEDFFPMSMRPQAHDIIRTWAFDTIVKMWMHYCYLRACSCK